MSHPGDERSRLSAPPAGRRSGSSRAGSRVSSAFGLVPVEDAGADERNQLREYEADRGEDDDSTEHLGRPKRHRRRGHHLSQTLTRADELPDERTDDREAYVETQSCEEVRQCVRNAQMPEDLA